MTYGDINEVLPEEIITPEDLEEVYNRLRNLDVEIVDQAEVFDNYLIPPENLQYSSGLEETIPHHPIRCGGR